MKILKDIRGGNIGVNYTLFDRLYLYTNYSKPNNTISVILSSIKLDDRTKGNKELQKEFCCSYLNSNEVTSAVNALVSECLVRDIKVKCVTNLK